MTREEQYLTKIAGEETDIPNKPILRSEQYLAKIAGEDVEFPEKPLTNEETYLAILAGEDYEIPAPYTQLEQYMAKACGLEIEVPTPITRVEQLWAQIAEGGSWTITEITATLPLTFLSKGDDLIDYRIHGTSEGAGVETETKIYGWHVDPSTSDPAQAITYLGDAIGKTPAAMGIETFSYGDWSDAFFMPKPCMVRSNGTVDYYLDPNDYTKKADGTASDVADPSYDGNAMMEWPLLWWKYEAGETEGEGYFYVANRKPDNTYHCWCNYDADDNVTEHFYTAIYNGTGTDKIRSISGVALTNANGNGGTTATQEITRAEANNTTDKTEWYIDVWADRMLINGLLILMGKSLNSQAVFGRGLDTSGQSAKEAYITGTLNDKGLFWGNTLAGTSGVKVFGMENYWGCVWHRTAGLIGLANGNTAYKLTHGTADGTTANGYNTNGNGYLVETTARPANGYFKTAKFGKFGYLPLTTGGSSTTYYSDYCATNNLAQTFALAGGNAAFGAYAGCSCFYLYNTPDGSSWNFSSSLSFKPLAKTTPDTDIIPPGYKLPLTVESGETENLFDKNNANLLDGYIAPNDTITSANYASTFYVSCQPNTTYTICKTSSARFIVAWTESIPSVGSACVGQITDHTATSITITTGSTAQYLIAYYYNSNTDTLTGQQIRDTIMVVKGPTTPSEYIPHRYTSDIPIYIGDSKLGEEEYVDFGEQKVYRCYSELTLKGNEENLYYYGVFDGIQTFYLDLPDNEANAATNTPYLSCNYYSTTYIVEPAVNKTCRYRRIIDSQRDIWTLGRIYLFDDDYTNLSDFRSHLAELYNNGAPLKISYLLKDAPIPTDPPVPLLPIPTYKGENTLSSTEALGEVTVKGRIKEAVPNG